MVDLVLNTGRPEPGKILLLRDAVTIQPCHRHLGGARHLTVVVRDRQTALFITASVLRLRNNLRVEHNQKSALSTVIRRTVEYDQPLKHAHLRCSQTDARRGIHGFHHIICQPSQAVRQISHRSGGFFQPRIGMQEYISFHGPDLEYDAQMRNALASVG